MTVGEVLPSAPKETTLEEDERIIAAGLGSFVEVGQALARVKVGLKYQKLGFDTFEDYCKQRWDLSKSYANTQIGAARVVGLLEGGDLPLPRNHEQTRPLVTVLNEHGEEAVQAVWEKIVERHEGDTPITGKEVRRYLTNGGVNYGKPGWRELLGDVGDTLALTDKKLSKVEAALTRVPNQSFREKAGEYATQAEALAMRLRSIEAAT